MDLFQAAGFDDTPGSYWQSRNKFTLIALSCSEVASAQKDLPRVSVLSLKVQPRGYVSEPLPSQALVSLTVSYKVSIEPT